MKNSKIVSYALVCLGLVFLVFGMAGLFNPDICYTIALTSISLANIWNGAVALRNGNKALGVTLMFAGVIVMVVAYTLFIAPLISP